MNHIVFHPFCNIYPFACNCLLLFISNQVVLRLPLHSNKNPSTVFPVPHKLLLLAAGRNLLHQGWAPRAGQGNAGTAQMARSAAAEGATAPPDLNCPQLQQTESRVVKICEETPLL